MCACFLIILWVRRANSSAHRCMCSYTKGVLGPPGDPVRSLRRLTAMTLLYSIYRSLFLTIFSQIVDINIRNYGWFRAVKRIYLRNCVSLDVPRHPQYPPRPQEHNLTGHQRPAPVLNQRTTPYAKKLGKQRNFLRAVTPLHENR